MPIRTCNPLSTYPSSVPSHPSTLALLQLLPLPLAAGCCTCNCCCICRRLISANICKFTLTVCNPSLARDDDPAGTNCGRTRMGRHSPGCGWHASGISDNCRRVALNEQRLLLLWQLLCCSGPHATLCERDRVTNKVEVMHAGHAIAWLQQNVSY